jgi:hypothetical protein
MSADLETLCSKYLFSVFALALLAAILAKMSWPLRVDRFIDELDFDIR